MQRIKKVRWPRRNIGGDRAYAKLYYVRGIKTTIQPGSESIFNNVAFNLGAWFTPSDPINACTISENFGQTPNLSTLAQFYQRYRIRGIKLKITTYPIYDGTDPIVCFTNAQANNVDYNGPQTGPSPAFPTVDIATTPELRWAKTRVCGNASAGAKPAVLTAYYSVNKVQGPDAVVKNDLEYTGAMQTAPPYWGQIGTTSDAHPTRGPWLQYGWTTLSGEAVPENQPPITIVAKVEATVYTQFFQKRILTQ